MRVCVKRDLSDSCQHLQESGIARKVRVQHQRVDEKADQIFDLLPVPVADRSPYDDPLLPCVSIEQELEDREQCHKQRNVRAQAQFVQCASRLRINYEFLFSTLE